MSTAATAVHRIVAGTTILIGRLYVRHASTPEACAEAAARRNSATAVRVMPSPRPLAAAGRQMTQRPVTTPRHALRMPDTCTARRHADFAGPVQHSAKTLATSTPIALGSPVVSGMW